MRPRVSLMEIMASRIILSGASSVGKTTTANDWWNKHKNVVHIQEIARDYMREHSITREDMEASLSTKEKKLFLELQQGILEEQNKCELAVPKDRPLISDRGPDPLIFACQYVNCDAAGKIAQTPAGRECLERYRNSLVVVLCPLAKPTDDGFRFVPTTAEQKEFTALLCDLLYRYRIPYIYVDETDRHRRIAMLERAVKGELQIPIDLDRKRYPLNVPFTIHEKSGSQQQQQSVVSIRALHFTTDEVQSSFKVFPSLRTNRMISRYGKENFVLNSFDKKVPPHVVVKVLHKGLLINGEEYHFLGCSSSGLRNRTCYLYKGTEQDVKAVLEECGSFSQIKSVSVKLKRIGLLFSEAYPMGITISDDDIVEREDIERGVFNFTDGCGAISVPLAKRIKKEASEQEDYLPCVFQIRHQGCKGVVMIDPSLKGNQMMIRKSMKKFNPGTKPFPELWLCDYSRPYSFGHLNKQFIMLLSGLGVKDDVFLSKQMEHHERLEVMAVNPTVAFEMLQWNNQPGLAARVAKCNQEELEGDQYLQKEILKLKSKLVEKLEKLHLLVPESRNVFGVCDPLGVLKYGECFFRPTIRGEPCTLSGYVTVSKNPCYLLGDVRRLKAVSDGQRVQQLEHLVDCIVFPTEGKQPHPNEIAGSDLDGDQYFVCWEKDLIVPTTREPYDYPASISKAIPPQMKEVEYFAQQNEISKTMGKIDSFFKCWADRKGIDCSECEELGKHFAHSVDSAKTGAKVVIPRNLVPPKQTSAAENTAPKLVWTHMEELATDEKHKLSQKLIHDSSSGALTEDFVWNLLQDEELNMSDFQLFSFVKRWCYSQQCTEDEALSKLLEFCDYINFGKFTVDQQMTAIEVGVPREIVTNALNKSQLLTPSMRVHFSLDSPHCGWRFYFRFDPASFEGCHLLRALERYPESMVIFQLPTTVTVALHFLTQLQYGTTKLHAGSVVAYFFSPHFGLSQRFVLGPEYTIELDSEMLQLYRGKKQATFIKLAFESKERSSQHTPASDETVYDQMSVDLTSFKKDIFTKHQHPKVRKENFQCIEVFVKSVDHKPAHFDILLADFPSEFQDTSSDDHVEELPLEELEESEEEEQLNLESTKLYSRDVALEMLKTSAQRGNSNHYQTTLQVILSNEGDFSKSSQLVNALQSSLLTLLTTMVAKSGNRHSTQTAECIQTTVETLLFYCFQTPQSKLKLLDRLCRLHYSSLASQIIHSFQTSEILDYFEAVSYWQGWCFLPQEDAHQLLDTIKPTCDSTQSAVPVSRGECTDSQEQLPTSTAPCSDGQSMPIETARYTVNFAHVLLHRFIDEMHNLRSQALKEDLKLDSCLVKLRAYYFSDPHHDSKSSTTVHADANEPEQCRVGFTSKTGISSAKFSVGTYVMVSPMKMSSLNEVPPVALGRVVQVSRQPANLVLEMEEPIPYRLRLSAKLSKGHWQMNLVGNVVAFKRSVKAIHKTFSDELNSTTLLPLLVHPQRFSTDVPPSSVSDATSPPSDGASLKSDDVVTTSSSQSQREDVKSGFTSDSSFNESQQRAIEAAVSHKVTLIHGPPGTGKTHVACEIICRVCQKLSSKKSKVLVAAETNMAVDNMTRKLLQRNVMVVRVGKAEHVAEDVRHVSLENQVEIKSLELGEARKKSHFVNSQVILNAAEVVATTCTGAGDPILKNMIFPFVVIDEATQATEPVSLVPLVHKCEQLTLIGDPEQLPPTLLNSTDTTDSLSVSLFHRLHKVLPSFFLEEQHRMHPVLAEFPSKAFYAGRLKSAACLEKRTSPLDVEWLNKDKPLVFIDVRSTKEKRFSTSFQNTAEAEMVEKVVVNLLSKNVNQTEIAVLTPYVGQVNCIREKLRPVAKCVEVCSVDGFQGREKDVIVFSTVRTQAIGFTGDRHRVNVLLTRAKHGIIGIGNLNALSADPTWEGWLKHVQVVETEKLFQKEHNIRTGSMMPKGHVPALCKYIEGGCRNGGRCVFAHSQAELKEWSRTVQPRAAVNVSKASQKSRTDRISPKDRVPVLCRFIEHGCRNGMYCRYAHSQTELEEWTQHQRETGVYNVRPSTSRRSGSK